MFGVDSSEFLLIAIVALVVIGPKDLPKAMRVVGYWVGKARGISRSFRQGFDNMVREAELEEMEKRWAAENARIMAEHPASSEAESLAAAEPVAPAYSSASDGSFAGMEHDAPVMVEKPVVAPATAAADENNAPVMVEKPAIVPAPATAAANDARTAAEQLPRDPAPIAAATIDTPVTVEKPVVASAPEHHPAPRPDSTPS